MNPLLSLLKSRAVLLGLVDVAQILIVRYAGLPDDIWQAINALLLVIIGKIAVEDAAAKFSGNFPPKP